MILVQDSIKKLSKCTLQTFFFVVSSVYLGNYLSESTWIGDISYLAQDKGKREHP